MFDWFFRTRTWQQIHGGGDGESGVDDDFAARGFDNIDEIVRIVRFNGWQNTHRGERDVKNALRKTLFKYKLHQDHDLFDGAYGCIRRYY